MKKTGLRELRTIPGVGEKISLNLWGLGIHSIQDLKDRDPEELYFKLCTQKCSHIDRCVLYVFKCAVYYASNDEYDPLLLKWWNWKDSS